MKRAIRKINHTRLSSAARLTRRFGKNLAKLNDQEDRKQFHQDNSNTAAKNRETLWRRWLLKPTWPITDAAHLILGRDPEDPYIANERGAGEGPQLHGIVMQRLTALASEKKLTRANAVLDPARWRYTPTQLISLAVIQRFPYAEDLKNTKAQMQSASKLRDGPAAIAEAATQKPSPRKRKENESIPYRRAQLVHEYACRLNKIDPTTNIKPVFLGLRVEEFNSGFQNQYRTTDPQLANCQSDAMEAARTRRSPSNPMPKVYLKSGRPVGSTSRQRN